MPNYTYSFLDVSAAISGPGGNFSLTRGGVATEGITVTRNGDQNAMQVGADGQAMHSLRADRSGTITVRLLKANPLNALLSQMYAFQTSSSAYHGQNTISVRNNIRGDDFSGAQAAFKRLPAFANAQDADMIEWAFDCAVIDGKFGDGTPG